MRIRTITVDFWGTLLFDGPRSDDRYRDPRLTEFEAILGREGFRVSREALERGYAASGLFLGRVWSRNRDVAVTEHIRVILGTADPTLPDRVSSATLAALVEAYGRPLLRVPPAVDDGALAALETLCARGYTLALVSNTMRTPGATLRKLLEAYRLLPCFAHTTFSDEVGVRKPDPEIFALTLRAVGGDPAAAVHVGDDPVLDVQGARAAGMRVIQVSSGSATPRPRGPRPDATIPSLTALPDAVTKLEG